MIRAIILAALMTGIAPAMAQDNNPFSGATSISVEMTQEVSIISPIPDGRKNRHHPFRHSHSPAAPKIGLSLSRKTVKNLSVPFRLHCTMNGKPMAEWREKAGHYRVKLDGEWSNVPPDAAGPMMVLLWAGGARCGSRR